MSKFFDKSDLIRNDVDKIVSDTLKNCDDGELYFEESKSESILLDDNKIKSSNYSSDLGFGFRAISKDVVAYSHSNEISKDSLKNSSENLKSTLKSVKGTYNHEIPKTNNKFYDDINPIDQKTLKSKLEILNNVNDFLRQKDISVTPDISLLFSEFIDIGTGNIYVDTWLETMLYKRNKEMWGYDKMYVSPTERFFVGLHARNTRRLDYNVTVTIGEEYLPYSEITEKELVATTNY